MFKFLSFERCFKYVFNLTGTSVIFAYVYKDTCFLFTFRLVLTQMKQ